MNDIKLFKNVLPPQRVSTGGLNVRGNYLNSDQNIKSSILSSDYFKKSDSVKFKGNSEINFDDFPGKKLGLAAEEGTPEGMDSITDLVNKIAAEESGKQEPYIDAEFRKPFISTIKKAMEVPGAHTILIKNKDKLVGCAQLTGYCRPYTYSDPPPPMFPKMAILRNVYLEKEYRGKKIMRWVLDKLIEQARNESIFDEIRLSATNPVAVGMYERRGFVNYDRKKGGEYRAAREEALAAEKEGRKPKSEGYRLVLNRSDKISHSKLK